MLTKVKLSKVNNVLTNNIYANICFLSEENFGDITTLYNEVSNSMDNKNWLKNRNYDALKKTVDNGGFIIGCYVGLELIACALCDVPNINDLETLASLNISVEDFQNTYISGFVMVHPMYRGNSLQLKLLDLRIDIAKSQGKKYIVTVAAVDNIHSLNNIVSRGFEFKTQQENNHGILRNIFIKDLFPNDANENIINEENITCVI
ncbi:MAG: hypothetical protein RR942_14360 [Romboutsia sp.]|uniref:hypothetical protein n=1 Tax=Paraclostridium sp. TaxID=2023273 RepID=UPI003AA6E062